MSSSRSPLRVGDLFPNLNAVSTVGEIESLHAYFGGSWGLILVQPRAFAPIGTVELAEAPSARVGAPRRAAHRAGRMLERRRAQVVRRLSPLAFSLFLAAAPRSPWHMRLMVGAQRARARLARARQDVRGDELRGGLPAIGDEKYELADRFESPGPARPRTARQRQRRRQQRAPAADPAGRSSSARTSASRWRDVPAGRRHELPGAAIVGAATRGGRGVLTPVNWVRGQDVFVAEGVPVEGRAAFPRGVHLIDLPSARLPRITPDPLVDARRADEAAAPRWRPPGRRAGEMGLQQLVDDLRCAPGRESRVKCGGRRRCRVPTA